MFCAPNQPSRLMDMVACDRKYEFNDYIEKYSDFIKIENNK